MDILRLNVLYLNEEKFSVFNIKDMDIFYWSVRAI